MINIYLLTSDSESCPMVLLEALAHGVPCIATDAGDSKEIIDEFQRLHEDGPLTSRMKQIIKFPDQFVENMETLLNNKAFNTLQPLFRILRG